MTTPIAREHHDVLPALTGPEDEEAVAAVVGGEGHEHDAHDAGGGDRSFSSTSASAPPGGDLDQAGHPGVGEFPGDVPSEWNQRAGAPRLPPP